MREKNETPAAQVAEAAGRQAQREAIFYRKSERQARYDERQQAAEQKQQALVVQVNCSTTHESP